MLIGLNCVGDHDAIIELVLELSVGTDCKVKLSGPKLKTIQLAKYIHVYINVMVFCLPIVMLCITLWALGSTGCPFAP